MDELETWLKDKVTTCPDHPHRVHTNFWLSEWWYDHDHGMEKSASSTIDEKLMRTANDCTSALQSLGVEDKKKAKQSMEEQVKQWVSKVIGLSQRLGKLLSSVELKLPSFKRSMSVDMFKKLRCGLSQCRETKEMVWDQLEDVKVPLTTEEGQADQLKKLQQLYNTLKEHMEALQEASSKQQPQAPAEPPIKAEEAATPPDDEAAPEA